jgi:hypothetical protein
MSFEELKIYIDNVLLHLLIIIIDNTEISPSQYVEISGFQALLSTKFIGIFVFYLHKKV